MFVRAVEMAGYSGVEAYMQSVSFDCTTKELHELVSSHNSNPYDKLISQYDGVHELCRRLHTSPADGNISCLLS